MYKLVLGVLSAVIASVCIALLVMYNHGIDISHYSQATISVIYIFTAIGCISFAVLSFMLLESHFG